MMRDLIKKINKWANCLDKYSKKSFNIFRQSQIEQEVQDTTTQSRYHEYMINYIQNNVNSYDINPLIEEVWSNPSEMQYFRKLSTEILGSDAPQFVETVSQVTTSVLGDNILDKQDDPQIEQLEENIFNKFYTKSLETGVFQAWTERYSEDNINDTMLRLLSDFNAGTLDFFVRNPNFLPGEYAQRVFEFISNHQEETGNKPQYPTILKFLLETYPTLMQDCSLIFLSLIDSQFDKVAAWVEQHISNKSVKEYYDNRKQTGLDLGDGTQRGETDFHATEENLEQKQRKGEETFVEYSALKNELTDVFVKKYLYKVIENVNSISNKVTSSMMGEAHQLYDEYRDDVRKGGRSLSKAMNLFDKSLRLETYLKYSFSYLNSIFQNLDQRSIKSDSAGKQMQYGYNIGRNTEADTPSLLLNIPRSEIGSLINFLRDKGVDINELAAGETSVSEIDHFIDEYIDSDDSQWVPSWERWVPESHFPKIYSEVGEVQSNIKKLLNDVSVRTRNMTQGPVDAKMVYNGVANQMNSKDIELVQNIYGNVTQFIENVDKFTDETRINKWKYAGDKDKGGTVNPKSTLQTDVATVINYFNNDEVSNIEARTFFNFVKPHGTSKVLYNPSFAKKYFPMIGEEIPDFVLKEEKIKNKIQSNNKLIKETTDENEKKILKDKIDTWSKSIDLFYKNRTKVKKLNTLKSKLETALQRKTTEKGQKRLNSMKEQILKLEEEIQAYFNSPYNMDRYASLKVINLMKQSLNNGLQKIAQLEHMQNQYSNLKLASASESLNGLILNELYRLNEEIDYFLKIK